MNEIENLEMNIEILQKILKEDLRKGGENQDKIKKEIKIFKAKLTKKLKKYEKENN